MSGLDDIRWERLKKLQLLRERGIDPYPAESQRTHENKAFIEQFESLSKDGTAVTLAGRIMSLRDQGGIVFADLYDGTGKVQALIKQDDLGAEAFQLFIDTVDTGDFIEVTGTPFTTKRGVNSLSGASWRMLTKSIRQIPDQWFGIKDEDERYRKRYLDILMNQEVAERLRRRSVFWNTVRWFMLARGFVEVETPILETTPGGAEARPFITHHNALDIDVYLRISGGELWQKRLMVAGIPKTFEIGRIFRNEGMSFEHAQDYTQFEFYESYQDGRGGVPMLIDLYREVAQQTFGTLTFSINNFDVNLGAEWQQLDYSTLMDERYGFDPRTVTLDEVKKYVTKEGIAVDATVDLGRGVDLLWKKVRKSIAGPAILTGMPVYLEPLAKKNTKDPRVVDRFQLLIAGTELGKGFNELNDPEDQAERFRAQQALRDAGDPEAQMADPEYVEALEYGMPPSFGFGVSERLFSYLAGTSIREAQAFPLMRPRGSES